MAHYLFNFSAGTQPEEAREQAAGLLQVKMWGIRADERHRSALVPGDLILIYLGAPQRAFIGRATLTSAARDWTPPEAQLYPGDSTSGVLLAQVEEWNPPVPVNAVLSQIDPAENAKGDFQASIVRITPHEYRTVVTASTARPSRP
jgi:hypothetical protein